MIRDGSNCESAESARVARAVEAALGVMAQTVERLAGGEVNRVYRVETVERAYAVKVFSHADWPEPCKLPWVERRLALHEVPHARMIHYTRDSTHFPSGFSVSEFVEGENCKAAIRGGRLSPAAYFELAGALLSSVHEIGVPRYGYIGDGCGTDGDFIGWLLACDVRDGLREIDDGTNPAETLFPLIEEKVEPVLRRFESRFSPVLIHVDCTPKNALLGGAARLVLIDWDEAAAGFWVRDYAGLTYWYSFIHQDGGGSRAEADEVRDSFFRGYGEPDFDREELREIEWAMHTAQAAGVLSYLYRIGDGRGFERTRDLLSHLLDTPPTRRGRT